MLTVNGTRPLNRRTGPFLPALVLRIGEVQYVECPLRFPEHIFCNAGVSSKCHLVRNCIPTEQIYHLKDIIGVFNSEKVGARVFYKSVERSPI